MDAVTLRHVDKAYTSYSTEIVITGEQRQSCSPVMTISVL